VTCDVGQRAEREAVDQHRPARRNLREHLGRVSKRLLARKREALVEFAHFHAPALALELLRHAPVVDRAARPRVEPAGYDDGDRFHELERASMRPSYAADATCDSCNVTRSASISLAPAPRSPRRMACA